MINIDELTAHIFKLEPRDDEGFDRVWQQVFAYQRDHSPVYSRYCKSIGDIATPYLPLEAFKHVPVTTFNHEEADLVFKSSGTGSGGQSLHYVRDRKIYEQSFSRHFSRLFGAGPITLIAHLPHYEQMGASSSLLYMVEHLMSRHGDEHSAFFLNDHRKLVEAIAATRTAATPFVLFGAAFGLLDLVERQPVRLAERAIVVETGGMKTYRREITRTALHASLARGFQIPDAQVWSEYGMCELLSQCYARGGHIFYPPPWMRFEIINPAHPLEVQAEGVPGVLAVIDLANLHSVSAILTQDRAVKRGEGFEVMGRLSGAELRGCNFLLEQA